MNLVDFLMTILYWVLIGGLMIFMTSFAVLLSEAKHIQKNWTAPAWMANIAIAVLSIFTGLPIFGVLKLIGIPAGPWNLVIVILFGVITKNIILGIARKRAPEKLSTLAMKHFA